MLQENKYIPLLFGILSTAGIILLTVVVVIMFGIYIHTISFFFIIPAGAILVGMGCGVGIFVGILVFGKRPQLIYYIGSLILSVVGFVGIYYTLYTTSYVTPDLTINHTFEGEHISSYSYSDEEGPITFKVFLLNEIRSRRSSFFIGMRRRGGGRIPIPIGSAELGSTYNWIKFGLEGLGFLVGGLLIGPLILGDRRYCDHCEHYLKDRSLRSFHLEEYQEVVQSINKPLSSGTHLREILKPQDLMPQTFKEAHVRIDVSHCPSCFEGFLLVKFMDKTSDGFEESIEDRQTISLNSNVLYELMS